MIYLKRHIYHIFKCTVNTYEMNFAPTWCRHQHLHQHNSLECSFKMTCAVLLLSCFEIFLFPHSIHQFYCVLVKNQHKNHLISHIICSPCGALFTFEVIHAYDAAWPLCVFWPYLEALEAGRKTDGACTGPLSKFSRKRFKSISKHKKKESEPQALCWKRCTSFTLRQIPLESINLSCPLRCAHLSYKYDVCVWAVVPLRAMIRDLHCVVFQGATCC